MAPPRTMLPIPAIGYGETSPVCFIGSVMRLMDFIGDPIAEDELFALSGAGLCFPWGFGTSCDEVTVIPDIPARTFAALGYDSEYLTGAAIADKAWSLQQIEASISRGRPVIGFGITTSMPMACLIVGHDEHGLITRSYWPPAGQPDPDAYFHSPEWYENCAGLLLVGEKTGTRAVRADAYRVIADWASEFRACPPCVLSDGQEIFVGARAFDAISDWLLDDTAWSEPIPGANQQYLEQAGLLLYAYYRDQLLSYLRQLDAAEPGLVNPAVIPELERIAGAIPGKQASQLWLDRAVDPALVDFAAMSQRRLREKVAKYVLRLRDLDSHVLSAAAGA